jgi:AcrR family transcriptional regulator
MPPRREKKLTAHRETAHYGSAIQSRKPAEEHPAGAKARQVAILGRTELRILKAARVLLREDGYRHVTIRRLADGAGCTPPTVYRYFADVDDVIAALCVQSTLRRVELHARAERFNGRPRERFYALGAITQQLSSHHMVHGAILYNPGFLERIPARRRSQLLALEDLEIEIAVTIIGDAIGVGDLRLPSDLTPVQFAISISSVTLGLEFTMRRGGSFGNHNLESPIRTWQRTAQIILDDLGWRPLFRELDYEASVLRMWSEVFPEIVHRYGIDWGALQSRQRGV